MKFKNLEWWGYGITGSYSTLFGGVGVGFASVIVFEKDGSWHLHYESEDPSEKIFTGPTKESVLEYAQNFQNENVLNEFFEETDYEI